MTSHIFALDRNSDAYKTASFVPPEGVDYIGHIFTASQDGDHVGDIRLNLFNTQTQDDAAKGSFIYTLWFGEEDHPDYVKHWYLSNFDVCKKHLQDGTNIPIDQVPSMKLTRYW